MNVFFAHRTGRERTRLNVRLVKECVISPRASSCSGEGEWSPARHRASLQSGARGSDPQRSAPRNVRTRAADGQTLPRRKEDCDRV
eukprot:5557573-Pleurochrysis_carterae.AAC.2